MSGYVETEIGISLWAHSVYSCGPMWERTYYDNINLLIVTSLVVFCQNLVCVILCIYYFGACSSAKGRSCVLCIS